MLQQPSESGPGIPVPALAASQPFPPNARHFVTETRQACAIARDPVVCEMSTQLLAQRLVLLRDRLVSAPPAPLSNGFDRSGKSAVGRLSLHYPVPFLR